MMQRVLIVNCFETYEHRAELLREYFQDLGCEVKIITSDWLHVGKAVRQTCPKSYEMLHVLPYHKNLSPQRLMSHYGFAQTAREKMEEFCPDLLWVFIPPNSLAKAAAQYKIKHPSVKLIMDFIDMWPETMPISRFKSVPPFSSWQNLRDRYVNYADLLVTECDLYHTVLSKVTNKNIFTLYLAREGMPVASDPNLPSDRTALCYLGSINNIIDIPCIARIIESIEGAVELHIIGDGEKRQELIDAASSAGAEVIYHGKIYDREEKQRILDRCHFGLNIMKESVFVGLTMKSMDYWEASLPVINNIRGDTWELVQRESIGLNYVHGEKLSEQKLQASLENRNRVRDVFIRNFSAEAFYRSLDAMIAYLNG